jgi:MSHA biogenesis protein MshI
VTASAEAVAAAIIERNPGQGPRLVWSALQTGSDSAQALKTLARSRDARDTACAGVLAGGEYSVVMVDAPDVPPAELREAVRWRVNELINFHVDDAVIDIFDVPGAGDGRLRRLYAVAARRDAVQRVVGELTTAGLRLASIDIPELALRNVAALLPEDEAGVGFVALERERGILTVTRRGELFLSRRFDYGVSRLNPRGAEDITSEMEGALDTLVIEIQRSLDYYERHFAQPVVQGVVFAPAPGLSRRALDYLASQLGTVVRQLDLHEVLPATPTLAAAVQQACLTAIGLALRVEELQL